MRILAFGGWGQLGTDLSLAAVHRHEFVRPRHMDVDVTDEGAVDSVVTEVAPDAVINMAAFHKVEACEEHPAIAFRVNTLGALIAGRASNRVGAPYVFVSTDYVFHGDQPGGYAEDDPPNAVNLYGVSKAAGEAAVRIAAPESLVVRGSCLFGHAGSAGKGGNFVDNMVNRARAGEKLSVVDDQLFSPTATRDMAERILLLLEMNAPPGTYHTTNSGTCSWYDLARTALELAGVEGDLSPRATSPGPVRRPQHSVLLDTKSHALGLPQMRPWQAALKWYLEGRP